MKHGYLVTMKGGFLGNNGKITEHLIFARKFQKRDKAFDVAGRAAKKLGLTKANWEVMSVSAYDTGGAQ